MRAALPMIAAAQKGYQRAPTSPGAVPAEGLNAARESNMATAAIRAIAAAVATWQGRTRGSLDPLELGGDVLMQLLVLAEELPEFEPRLEIGRQEEFDDLRLPIGGVVDLLKDVDPERLLLR